MKPLLCFVMIGSLTLTSMSQKSGYLIKTGKRTEPDTTISKKESPKSEIKYIDKNNITYVVRASSYNKSEIHREIETSISYESIPKPAREFIRRNYLEYEIREASRIINEENIAYEVELKKQNESFELAFDKNGRFLRKEPDDDDY